MVGIAEGLGEAAQRRLLEALWRALVDRPTISGDGATHYHGEVHFHGPVSHHGNVFYGSTHHHGPEAGAIREGSEPGEGSEE
jgi:hypothetical protein